jgi:hypothetical protein
MIAFIAAADEPQVQGWAGDHLAEGEIYISGTGSTC